MPQQPESDRLRHPDQKVPYFQELKESWNLWKDAITPDMVYHGYFSQDSQLAGVPFYRSLLSDSGLRPVFSDCRTSGRIGTLKRDLSGLHVFLWRNPWDQWWSYQLDDYFDVANRIILHAQPLPEALAQLAEQRQLITGQYDGYSELHEWYRSRPLDFCDSYTLFYLLWCLALKEGLDHADYRVNIDSLTASEADAAKTRTDLEELGITDLDFSDAQCPLAYYSEQERAEFEAIEASVHTLLTQSQWTEGELEAVLAERELHRPQRVTIEAPQVTDQLIRQRDLTKRFINNRSVACNAWVEVAHEKAESIQYLEMQHANTQHSMCQKSDELAESGQRLILTQAALEVLANESKHFNAMVEQATAQAEQSVKQAAAQAKQAVDQANAQAEQAVEQVTAQAEHWVEQAATKVEQLSLLSNARAQEIEALKGMYTELQASLSWRLTSPLRLLGQIAKAVTGQGMAREELLRGAARDLARYPRLSRAGKRSLRLVPPVYTRVIVALDGPLEKPPKITGQTGLNDRAREIHRGLAGRLGLVVDVEGP
jgi:hypothetical protein